MFSTSKLRSGKNFVFSQEKLKNCITVDPKPRPCSDDVITKNNLLISFNFSQLSFIFL